MINIPYEHGEMNIDIIKFLVNKNLNDCDAGFGAVYQYSGA